MAKVRQITALLVVLKNNQGQIFHEVKNKTTNIVETPEYFLIFQGPNKVQGVSKTEVLTFDVEFKEVDVPDQATPLLVPDTTLVDPQGNKISSLDEARKAKKQKS